MNRCLDIMISGIVPYKVNKTNTFHVIYNEYKLAAENLRLH